MREIERSYNTVDNSSFEAAKEAYCRLEDFFRDFNEKHIKFGFELLQFQKNKFYSLIKPKDENRFSCVYRSIFDFADAELGMKKRTVSNYIAVAKNFGDKEGNCQPKYKDYGFTQLVVMLGALKFAPCYQELFTADIRVEDMKLMEKGIKKGLYNFLQSVEENLIHINEFIEAEKAGKAVETMNNIEAVEEKYAKDDKVTEDGELIPGEDEKVHLNALSDKKTLKKIYKTYFRENDYGFTKKGKSISLESAVDLIIKLLPKSEGV